MKYPYQFILLPWVITRNVRFLFPVSRCIFFTVRLRLPRESCMFASECWSMRLDFLFTKTFVSPFFALLVQPNRKSGPFNSSYADFIFSIFHLPDCLANTSLRYRKVPRTEYRNRPDTNTCVPSTLRACVRVLECVCMRVRPCAFVHASVRVCASVCEHVPEYLLIDIFLMKKTTRHILEAYTEFIPVR